MSDAIHARAERRGQGPSEALLVVGGFVLSFLVLGIPFGCTSGSIGDGVFDERGDAGEVSMGRDAASDREPQRDGGNVDAALAMSMCGNGVCEADEGCPVCFSDCGPCVPEPAPANNVDTSQAPAPVYASGALPPLPSIMREVTNYYDGRNTRVHVPPAHSSLDGRVILEGAPNGPKFYLMVPEKLETSLVSAPADLSILATEEAWDVDGDFGGRNGDSTGHRTLCDPGQNPRPCGEDGASDCYDLVVIQPKSGRGVTTLWGVDIMVRVDAPKTAQAHIAEIVKGTPEQGYSFDSGRRLLETHITDDGHVLFSRALPVTGAFGYLYSLPTDAPCDVTAFRGPFPYYEGSSWDPQDFEAVADIQQHWDFMNYPQLDARGQSTSSRESHTYPMIDANGKNVWFYTRGAGELSDYEIRCVPDTGCTDPRPEDTNEGTKELVVLRGAWTGGKAVTVDNMVNPTDFNLGFTDHRHRLVKLYDGDDGWIRVGGSNFNTGAAPDGRMNNSGFMDSLEHRFNYLPQFDSTIPKDFAWWFSDGRGTDLVVFDEWVDPYVFVYSQMIESVPFSDDDDGSGAANNIQNSSCTQLYDTPKYGRIHGPGRVEPVALGGVRARGMWFYEDVGLEYEIPDTELNQNLGANQAWYVGLFLDPRFPDVPSGTEPTSDDARRVLTFPDGSWIDIVGRRRLVLGGDGYAEAIELPYHLTRGEFVHLGFRFRMARVGGSSRLTRLEFFRDGMLHTRIEYPEGAGPLTAPVRSGSLWVGKSPMSTKGFAGWIDEFKVIANADALNEETLCRNALGTVAGLVLTDDPLGRTSADPALIDEAARYPAFQRATHARLSPDDRYALYICYDHNRNIDGWVDVTALPAGVFSVANRILMPEGPVIYDQPRPDSRMNPYCASCHTSDGTPYRSERLLQQALEPGTVDFVDDPRRPLRRPAQRMFGNIPAHYFGPGMPAVPLKGERPDGIVIDQFLLRE